MYKLLLILKYLLKRRIAWVSLIAVTLCTAMVLVVISVMGGWLRMFEASFHGLSGDVIVQGKSGLTGFPYYQEMIDRIEQIPGVQAAVPVIVTFGLVNIGDQKAAGVQVMGMPIERIGQVMPDYPASLFLQNKLLLDEANDPKTPDAWKDMYRKLAALPPSFELHTTAYAPLDALPGGVSIDPAKYDGRFGYDAQRNLLWYKGWVVPDREDELLALSNEPTWKNAVSFLAHRTRESVIDYKMAAPRVRGDVTQWPGMIPGAGVLNIRKNQEGKIINRHPGLYRLNVTLTVLGNSAGGQMTVDVANKAEKKFWVVDDSRTGVYAYDSQTVYVDFNELQRLLNMTARTYTDVDTNKEATDPARATDIHIKVKGTPSEADLIRVRDQVQAVVKAVLAAHVPKGELEEAMPFVETWRQDKATYIDAIEHEKLLVTFLFGMISVVAVFLIFCIFYMIVAEKTKDIGIIKSVGATAQGVAGIFLGYGLAIGLLGGGLGLLAAFLITRYINEIHAWLGRQLGVQVWNPEVYQFDKIPNTMNPREVSVIVACAILSALLGAVIPALRAARMNPVEALRWE